jgi:hypothetical protein
MLGKGMAHDERRVLSCRDGGTGGTIMPPLRLEGIHQCGLPSYVFVERKKDSSLR